MSKEAPIETLNYYALVVSNVLCRPLDDTQRAALVVHVHKQLSDGDLSDLYGDGPCQRALKLTEKALADPRSFLPSAVRPVAARTTAELS
jgi:hypothetical protein